MTTSLSDCADCRSVTPCAVHTPEARARIAAHAALLVAYRRFLEWDALADAEIPRLERDVGGDIAHETFLAWCQRELRA